MTSMDHWIQTCIEKYLLSIFDESIQYMIYGLQFNFKVQIQVICLWDLI